jgi:hypothetical protein
LIDEGFDSPPLARHHFELLPGGTGFGCGERNEAKAVLSHGGQLGSVILDVAVPGSPVLAFVSSPAGRGYVVAAGPVFLRAGASGFSEVAVFGSGGAGAAYAINDTLSEVVH